MSYPSVIRENLVSLGDRLLWGMQQYGSIFNYETQAGIIAEPVTAPKGNGHVVVVLYTMYDPDRVFTWKYANGAWYGTEDVC